MHWTYFSKYKHVHTYQVSSLSAQPKNNTTSYDCTPHITTQKKRFGKAIVLKYKQFYYNIVLTQGEKAQLNNGRLEFFHSISYL